MNINTPMNGILYPNVSVIHYSYSNEANAQSSWYEWVPMIILALGTVFTFEYLHYKNFQLRMNKVERDPPKYNKIKPRKLEPEVDVETRYDLMVKQLAQKGFFLDTRFPGKSKIFTSPENPEHLIKYPAKDRAEKNLSAQEFCKKNGFKYLVIPNTKKENDYLIEEHLPISNISDQEQISLYCANPGIFRNAIEEFVKLLCLTKFDGLSSGSSPFCEINLGRVDNVLLYIKNNVGLIGLVDLERFNSNPIIPRYTHIQEACRTAILFFPYSYKRIIKIGQTFNEHISLDDPRLRDSQRKIIDFFKIIHFKHKDFLLTNRITLAQPTKIIEATDKIRADIIEDLTKKLDKPLPSFLVIGNKTPREIYFNSELNNETLSIIKNQLFPRVLKYVDDFMLIKWKEKIIKIEKESNISFSRLKALRTISFNIEKMIKDQKNDETSLKLQIKSELVQLGLIQNKALHNNFCKWVTDAVFSILEDSQIISGYANHLQYDHRYSDTDQILF